MLLILLKTSLIKKINFTKDIVYEFTIPGAMRASFLPGRDRYLLGPEERKVKHLFDNSKFY